MNYTESKKRLIPPKNDFSEFNEITLEDFKEGTSLEERLTTFRKTGNLSCGTISTAYRVRAYYR